MELGDLSIQRLKKAENNVYNKEDNQSDNENNQSDNEEGCSKNNQNINKIVRKHGRKKRINVITRSQKEKDQ